MTCKKILCNLFKEKVGEDMSYNKNIILEMLSSTFWDEIESFVERIVMDYKDDDLIDIFEQPTDYTLLDSIQAMRVLDFFTEQDDEKERIYGKLQIEASIEGYVHWDDEVEWLGDKEECIEVAFDFDVHDGICSNLKLAYGI